MSDKMKCKLMSQKILFIFIQDILQVVFQNGKLVKEITFSEVRKNAEIDLLKTEN